MKCDICQKGVEAGPMYRVNPLGEKGIFRHEKCGGVPVDNTVRNICNIISSLILLFLIIGCNNPKPVTPGSFSSDHIDLRLTNDGRTGILLEDFAFTDSNGKIWTCPKGQTTDGASIPQELWSTIGGPYEGKYRFAAVIHDRYCRVRTEPTKAVHRMFYEACITAGVEQTLAKIMYAGIYHFGPQWGSFKMARPTKPIEQYENEIKANPEISLDEIDKL